MIEHTKRMVEARYTVANGFPYDAEVFAPPAHARLRPAHAELTIAAAQVIYGDTDSVMIRFGSTERDAPEGHGDAQSWMIQHAMDAAIDAANHVNETFIRPIKLEFEKVYYPYLLMNKKRYAALLWTNPSKFDKMDCKGIETVRRDNCGLVRTVIDASLRMILVERAPERAVEFVKSSVRDLLMGRVDISELIITKALNKTLENSKSPQVFSRAHPPLSPCCPSLDPATQAHVILAARMRERDPSTAPVLGDRVPYVMIKGMKGAKAFEKAEVSADRFCALQCCPSGQRLTPERALFAGSPLRAREQALHRRAALPRAPPFQARRAPLHRDRLQPVVAAVGGAHEAHIGAHAGHHVRRDEVRAQEALVPRMQRPGGAGGSRGVQALRARGGVDMRSGGARRIGKAGKVRRPLGAVPALPGVPPPAGYLRVEGLPHILQAHQGEA